MASFSPTQTEPASNTAYDATSPEDQHSELPTVLIPPYWQQHRRATSYASVVSNGRPSPIRLEDNTEELEGVKSPLWAKLVAIDSHTVVSGNLKGVGDYVVWICRVETLDVGYTSYARRAYGPQEDRGDVD